MILEVKKINGLEVNLISPEDCSFPRVLDRFQNMLRSIHGKLLKEKDSFVTITGVVQRGSKEGGGSRTWPHRMLARRKIPQPYSTWRMRGAS